MPDDRLVQGRRRRRRPSSLWWRNTVSPQWRWTPAKGIKGIKGINLGNQGEDDPLCRSAGFLAPRDTYAPAGVLCGQAPHNPAPLA